MITLYIISKVIRAYTIENEYVNRLNIGFLDK